jgi:GT2 family glycosyltransferase
MVSDVAVVVVNWNGAHYLPACLTSLYGLPSVIVVDNGSVDGSAALVRSSFPTVRLVEAGHNLGFSAANNIGARQCSSRYILFLNNDTVVQAGAIEYMREAFHRDDRIAVVGARLEWPDGRLQSSSLGRPPSLTREIRRLLNIGYDELASGGAAEYDSSHYTSMVCGAAMMVRRDVFQAIGGWSERYFAYAEDADLCRQVIEREYRIWFETTARVIHHAGGSWKRLGTWQAIRLLYLSHRSVTAYIRKYHGVGKALLHRALFPASVLAVGLRRVGRAGRALLYRGRPRRTNPATRERSCSSST